MTACRHRTENPVPVPAAVWLFGTGLIGLIGISKRRKSA
ncbi:MAG: VPLPA-CTERM sorting domain-containing protein [Proteobacteria bacterium]|nr:VPLPA-CTERM sorting domain-containing protein [Pseudomonadota bacterium]